MRDREGVRDIHCVFNAFVSISSRRVFKSNTISPQGIEAVSVISEGKAPIPYGESYLI
jgi:hypothetical protein